VTAPARGPGGLSPITVLASGGLDSCVLVAHLLDGERVVQPLYIRFGLMWEAVEEAHLRRFLATLPTVPTLVTLDLPILDVYGDHWSTAGGDVPGAHTADDAVYLPGRNVLLLAKTSVWCALHGISTVALGTLRGNPFPDSTAGFFAQLSTVMSTALSFPIEVVTPFSGLDKSQVLALGRDLELQHTFSCIEPRDGLHCGQCNKCAERQRAFRELEVPDATRYAGR